MDLYLNKILLELKELKKHIKREDSYKSRKSADSIEMYIRLIQKESLKKNDK